MRMGDGDWVQGITPVGGKGLGRLTPLKSSSSFTPVTQGGNWSKGLLFFASQTILIFVIIGNLKIEKNKTNRQYKRLCKTIS